MAQILIIDDHQSMREGLELLLRRRGHRTLSAENGSTGMELLAERGAELVITDLKMARMDGLEVLQAVRERHPGVEVLVITAYGTIETAVEAMKLGATDFLTKPFSSEEVCGGRTARYASRTRSAVRGSGATRDPATGKSSANPQRCRRCSGELTVSPEVTLL